MSIITCRPRALTPQQAELARRRSVEINPANDEIVRTIEQNIGGRRGGRRLAVVRANRWPETGIRLSVQFLDIRKGNPLRQRILEHMNAWRKTANILFEETHEKGHVRIARLDDEKEGGFWSLLGTEILGVEDEDEPTMNLEGFTMKTEESEFRRVVRHEAGHTLGFDHEHMRSALVKKIDEKKAIAYYKQDPNFWTPKETREQVLTTLDGRSIMGTTEADPDSIMCYEIPGEITKDGKPIVGGNDINAKDYAFAAKVYPKTGGKPSFPEMPAPDSASPGKAGKKAQTAPDSRPPEDRPEPVPESAPGPAKTTSHDDEADTFHIVILDDFDPEDLRGQLAALKAGTKAGKTKAAANKTPDESAAQKEEDRPRYARVFASYGGARVSCPLRLRKAGDEPPTSFGDIIRIHTRIKNYTNREEGELPDDAEMKQFGTALFETLFQGDVRRLYDEARSRQHHRRLDLVFTSMVSWIAEKPWEFAYDKVRDSFLATEEIHLIRNVLTAVPANIIPLRSGPLRILVVSAQPVGFGSLSIAQEESVILRGFQPLIDAGSAVVTVLPHATPALIHGALSTGNYNVVHFIGHGSFNEDTEEGALIFENDRGGHYELGERSAREIFCQRGVSLVFLNACQTGSGGRADFNKGIAQALVAHGLPALVANQYSVLDSSATSFAQHFYWSLAQGMTLGQSAREARIAVNYSLAGDPIDWAVPVVYARDPNKSLCVPPPVINPVPATAVRRSSRRAIRDRRTRVAFWDIDNVFPALDATADRMNEAQKEFGFEVVSLSAPVDAWYLGEKAPDGRPYLWANKVAARLEKATVDLRVDIVACITRHWMCYDDPEYIYTNIYGWWPDNRETPVVLFSAAGLEGLKPEGQETDQLLANIMVLLIAGYFTGLDSHGKSDKKCPLYNNAERDFAHMIKPQRFDASCRAKLKKLLGEKLEALEALLEEFQTE